MLFWATIHHIKLGTPQSFKGAFAGFAVALLSSTVMSQTSQDSIREATANAVACYKTSIKEPLTFYGNPMDTFTLYDGTKWKVSNGGSYEYIPARFRSILICPSEQLLVIDKRAISVSRVSQ